MGKGQKKATRVRSNSKKHATPKAAIGLDASTRELIVSESKFLGLQPEEYVKLVMICAQVLRESSVQTPIEDSTLLRSLIGSPLLLTMARTFASNYLSTAIRDIMQSQQTDRPPQSRSPGYPMPNYYTQNPRPQSPGIYPEWHVPVPMQQYPPIPSENHPPRHVF